MHSAARLLVPLLQMLAAAGPSWAGEAWADPNLKVTDGLQLWLDAGRQNAARAAMKKPELAHGQAVPLLYDASGKNRHFSQADARACLTFHAADGHTALRFDGERQHLRALGLDQSYKDVTLFVVDVPFSNAGDFRAFLAFNQKDRNDYVTGLTLDQGPGGTPRLSCINVEGSGFGGAANLLKTPLDFGVVQRFCVTSTIGKDGTRLHVNGAVAGHRERTDSMLRMDQFTLGARFYTNGGAPAVRGFLDGDVLEVLVYDRILSDAERGDVEKYLRARHGDARKVAMPPRRLASGKALVGVTNPPPVQVFVPGFTVHELPVDLPNINNLQYRADGKLVALAYDGNVYLLSDTDGDGLEDHAALFWDNRGRIRAPIGMALTPPKYAHGSGLFIASKGKCSLVVDTKGGDQADKEIVIANGWQEIPHGVDALGVAVDPRDGSVYFGLGTASYANGYQLGKDGKSQYRLDSERGTILRVAPDFKLRAILSTGIRFPVAIRFNRAGDLFCTDQEGATWLPNGNPFDELLHVEKGRHYGFPPRHPKHLPNVIDEPSVFDYTPQHQCTCGLNFNDPVNDGSTFGPAGWRWDALVTGYSRGKLYRTKLVKTAAGYVAQNQLFASLTMLPVDACVSPMGDLVVAVHSGGPDWGSGPNGRGKLYKIRYTGKTLAQPVLAWAQSQREVHVAFDRPIDAEHLRELRGKAAIEYGAYVAAGDRFEVQRPGYQVVQDQLRAPRFDLPIVNVQVTADRRTLILQTAPQALAAKYALTLPGLGRAKGKAKELTQVPETDLCYDLTGVEASWRGKSGDTAWDGWLPHADLAVARALTAGSASHEELWSRLQQPGTLTLRMNLDLADMLRPAVQPGSKLDHEFPPEEVALLVRCDAAFEIKGLDRVSPQNDKDGGHGIRAVVKPAPGRVTPVEIRVPTGAVRTLTMTFATNEDARARALPLRRFLRPWAVQKTEAVPVVEARDLPELKGGNWERGRQVFLSDQAGCARCHRVGDVGGLIGPDLSNLPHRDYPSVLRDITNPSFAINPDYITHVVALTDGRVLTGTLRTEGERMHLGDTQGKVTTFRRDQIDVMHTSPVSIMPAGIPEQLGPDRMKDLLVFLLSSPPRMPEYGKGDPPPPREAKEVEAILAGAPKPPEKTRKLRVVLVAGKKDHGPGEHDYPAWQTAWSKLLAMAEEVDVATATDWPAADQLKTADVLVFYQQGKWTAERARDIDAFLARGGGLVYIHYAVDGGADAPGFAQRIGLAWRGGHAKFRHGPLELGFEGGERHPIARNFDKLKLVDESYWNLIGEPKNVRLMASGVEDGKAQPLFWTLEPSKGRVFVSIPGHYAWTFDDPLFRVLLLRGIAWTAKEPVDRFNGLVRPGARIKP